MKRKFHHLLILFAAAGLFSGLAVRRFTPRVPASEVNSPNDATRSASEKSAPEIPRPTAKPAFPPSHSADTLETLAALDDESLYARLALWLADASEAEIAAFWSGYSKKEDRSGDITDLVFLNWTRLNPRATIAAVAGTDDELYAWRAWACNDPQAALTAVLAADPGFLEYVASGIGEFHPEWLKAHFKEIPEYVRKFAFEAMTRREDGESPLRTLNFMKENDVDSNPGTLKALVREDPWAAFDWAKKYPDDASGNYDNTMDLVLQTMATERPEDLQRLIAQTPSGETKLKMEAALFANLLKTDPAAALEQANATTIPRTAAERYAAIGLETVRTDPEQAFQLAQRLFSICPDAMGMRSEVEYPGGSQSSSLDIPGVDDFMESLMAKDPARMMETVFAGRTKDDQEVERFASLSNLWVERDFAGYVDWVNQQPDGKIRETGATLVSNQLQDEGQFAEACEWTMSRKDPENDELPDVLRRWNDTDPEAAAEWLESSDFPADRKATLKANMQEPW